MNVPPRLRMGWVGFHMEGRLALEALLQKGFGVEAVLTLAEPQAVRRSGVCAYDELCLRYATPLHKIANINDPDSIRRLRALELDVLFVIGWSQILSREALGAARLGVVGAHASLLPHNRGSAPVNWAIIRGETRGGNTLLWLNAEVDEGEIIDQVEFPITAYDTCATVYEKVALSNRDMILRLVPQLQAGQRPGRPQPATDEPVLPRRRPGHGVVDWNLSSRQVYDFIRALARPYPGAFSWLDGQRYRIWDAALLPGDPYPDAEPGRVIGPVLHPHPSQACGQVVACGQGAVVLLELETTEGQAIRGSALSEMPLEGKVWKNA